MKRESKRDRIRQIIAVFIKHSVTKKLKDPVNLRLAFEELGSTFIKIGQILSTRPDLVPPAYQKEFQKLQDTVHPEKFETIQTVLKENLHQPLDKVFSVFEKDAVAGASLAEVHLAVLTGGERVAVKIQRPKARETILNDIAILRLLCRFFKIGWLFDIVNMQDLLNELEKNIQLELDFLSEAQNIKRFSKNNRDVKYLGVPKVYDAYTTPNVLVMQYIDGIKIRNITALDAEGYDRQDIGTKLANNYMKQIFEDGFFHADPHPGNILVSGNQIVYVDFGLMGTLDRWTLKRLNNLLRGIAANDVDMMTEAILRLGIQKGAVDIERFRSEIALFYEKFIAVDFEELNIAELTRAVFKICQKNGIVIPKEVAMLVKGLGTIESVLAIISPNINMMTISANYGVQQFLRGDNIRHELSSILRNTYQSGVLGAQIPSKLFRLVDKMQAGGFTVKVKDPDRDRTINRISRMVNRGILGLLISSLVIGASIVLHTGTGNKWNGLSWIGLSGYLCAMLLAAFLFIDMLRSK
ncbi:ABC1 kinase family protein [Ethanoligenens sp.]|uniref:ABC1 kinase family protein n=1 Tax=Ethanoligenens sp. TaxID=2099655 RepID=UPI0039E9D387